MKKQVAKIKFSFVSPEGMGGIYGSKGYRFQDGYIVCRIAKLLAQENFMRLMPEASGDVDIVHWENSSEVYEHVQVKDHNVTNSEFQSILQSFDSINQGTGKIYSKFVLVAPSISKEIKQLSSYATRYREIKNGLFKGDVTGLKTTKPQIRLLLKKLKVEHFEKLILEKVHFEIAQSNFEDSAICKQLFTATLAEHPKYKEKILDVLKPVFAVLSETVSSHSGKILHNEDIHSVIDSVLTNSKPVTRSTRVHIHNWTSEQFDGTPDIELDWSKHFQRENKTVPDQKVWNKILIPKLIAARNQLLKQTSNRHIIFRGKCALSTGITIGCIFPEVGNWSFEVIQPPGNTVWRSDAKVITGYNVKHKEISVKDYKSNSGDELAFVFDITGNATSAVSAYVKENNIRVKKIIIIEPEGTSGNFSIKNDQEAMSLASASKDVMKQMIQKYRSQTSHLFFYGPLGLALFLGQKLTSIGTIQLYEFQDPGYKPSCLIKT